MTVAPEAAVAEAAPGAQAPTPYGTRRRLQALYARGWDAEGIERESGVPAAEIERIIDRATWRGRTRQGTDEAIATAYDRIADLPAPGPPQPGAESWPPPAAWDDGQLDVQGAQPEPGWRRTSGARLAAAEVAEDVAFLREHGGYRDASARELADRLGLSHDRLQRALERAAVRQAQDGGQPEAGQGKPPDLEAG